MEIIYSINSSTNETMFDSEGYKYEKKVGGWEVTPHGTLNPNGEDLDKLFSDHINYTDTLIQEYMRDNYKATEDGIKRKMSIGRSAFWTLDDTIKDYHYLHSCTTAKIKKMLRDKAEKLHDKLLFDTEVLGK